MTATTFFSSYNTCVTSIDDRLGKIDSLSSHFFVKTLEVHIQIYSFFQS